jgi:hypothetical protein
MVFSRKGLKLCEKKFLNEGAFSCPNKIHSSHWGIIVFIWAHAVYIVFYNIVFYKLQNVILIFQKIYNIQNVVIFLLAPTKWKSYCV